MSAYKVTVDQPNLPQGASVSISGLGSFENGSSAFVDEEGAETFERLHGVALLEADMYGVEVVYEESTDSGEQGGDDQ